MLERLGRLRRYGLERARAGDVEADADLVLAPEAFAFLVGRRN